MKLGDRLAYTCAGLAICFMSAVSHASDSGDPEPPEPFVDEGACPFECCTYRQWTAGEAITLLDEPEGKRAVASLQKGDVVDGLTGEVRSVPVPATADHDIPDTPIRAGDTYYVLHYDGEGYWKVWFKGELVQVHESVGKVPRPKADWWVKVRDARGNIGWTLSHGNFSHQDACE